MQRDIVILGSTGSIGTQAVEMVRRHPDRFRLVGLGAGGGRLDLLARQAIELGVQTVAVARPEVVGDLRTALREVADRCGKLAPPEVLAGPQALPELAARPCDLVVNGVTGSVGLFSTLAALDAGHTLALANKESLIVAGELVKARARPGQIVPVDSEHSAIAQCLRGGRAGEVARLVVTASGGPFRGRTRADLAGVTPAEALAHPTWSMGPVITVNSATLVNKGLELIEAHLLFDIPLDRITVVVHPQSIVHSMVEFVDGSTLAQASPPDMRLPIALALAWPDRLPGAVAGIDWTTAGTWEFLPLDDDAFPAVRLAREVGIAGGTMPAVYNAANEECVAAFLVGRLPFTGIVDTVARVVAAHQGSAAAPALDDVLAADAWARAEAARLVARPVRRVLLAKPRGYCAGVDRAVQTVEQALEHFSAPVYVRKQIVHNTHVVRTLEERGAIFVDEAEEVPRGATVVFSAHGVAPTVNDEAAARGLRVIDATCPLVTKVHKEARRFADEDYDILLIGHEGHEEVVGTIGEAPEHIHLVDGPDDVPDIRVRDPDKVVWLSQTTLSVDETTRIVEALRRRFPKLIDPPSADICYATQNRQVSVKEIAARSQLVIVVGSANSSNSVRLTEVAREAGAASYLVDNGDQVDPGWLAGVTTVGVTSGASVPEELVRGVLERLAGCGFTDVEEVESARETVVFSLPRELHASGPSR